MNKSKKNTKIKKNNKTKKITRNGVILITIDGVRRKEIYDKKIAPYLNKIKNKSYVKNINNMKVANKYKISYPGYNDMLTGIVNKNIKTNKIGGEGTGMCAPNLSRKYWAMMGNYPRSAKGIFSYDIISHV